MTVRDGYRFRLFRTPAKYHQTCKRCHRAQQFEFVVAHEFWRRVCPRGSRWHNTALCIECFLLLASRRGVIVRKKDIERTFIVQFYRITDWGGML